MEEFRLCNSDYRFMMLVWEHAPIGSGELVKLCAEKLGWKKSTTYTEIKRLCEKGVLQNEHAVVTPLVTQEEVQAKESDEFVERTFSGSLPGFLTAFLGNKKLSGKEAEELKKLIEQISKKMHTAAADLNFEAAATFRDEMITLKKQLAEMD